MDYARYSYLLQEVVWSSLNESIEGDFSAGKVKYISHLKMLVSTVDIESKAKCMSSFPFYIFSMTKFSMTHMTNPDTHN